ncbi:hypothetical protein [Lewinella sp. JB7]|uniref:hypothetical protein n=1 Tax=Lewinella sp. JB7 TaxID=2962887 RepID=UPI0020C9547E|nr:hypothetical protein [Lewinella sp. JB7]MCP9236629.1 hypothetical protein [Lewinella sp. JB7]
MKYLLVLLLLSTTLLPAQSDQPTFGGSSGDSGTFTGSSPSGSKTRDKGMGFGKKSAENANANERLQQARERTREAIERDEMVPASETDNFDEAVGLGYYYLQSDETFYEAAGYLDAAADNLDLSDRESVLGLFTLYSLLADRAYTTGDEDAANTAWASAEELIDDFFDSEPTEEDAYHVHHELGYVYYELGFTGAAAYHFDAALGYAPDDAYLAYMTASSLALAGEREEALEFLEFALNLGLLEDYEVDLAEDGDLDELRSSEGYQSLARDYGF